MRTVAHSDVADGEEIRRGDRILDVVVQILESEGYDAVQLREVARRSQTSLTTIYKRYTNRDELIAAALQSWMDEHRYAALLKQAHTPDEPPYIGLMGVFRTLFQPWEQHPAMLTAYFRARAAPSGQQLVRQGLDAVVPVALEVLGNVEESVVADLDTILTTLVYGLLGRFTAGEITVTEILPILERAVFRLLDGSNTRTGQAPDHAAPEAR